jgi:GH35 family endo-1,4-beta-xylanase
MYLLTCLSYDRSYVDSIIAYFTSRTPREYQAGNYARAVEACLSVPRCTDLMMWQIVDTPDFWFQLPYDDPAPTLFDQNFQPKPA